jgi:hypothetical protein
VPSTQAELRELCARRLAVSTHIENVAVEEEALCWL